MQIPRTAWSPQRLWRIAAAEKYANSYINTRLGFLFIARQLVSLQLSEQGVYLTPPQQRKITFDLRRRCNEELGYIWNVPSDRRLANELFKKMHPDDWSMETRRNVIVNMLKGNL